MKLPANTPKLVGHKNVPVRLVYVGYNMPRKYVSHPRLKIFYVKGNRCAHEGCSRIGYYLVQSMDSGGGSHLDLYTKDFHLMTIDHIHPKSKGGSNSLDNLQPMCEEHNQKKKDSITKPSQKQL